MSKVHDTNIHLVLNPLTGHISPQYHLVFDDHSSTVNSDGEFDADVWTSLFTSNLERNVDADNMVSTFEFESDNMIQLQSIPSLPINLPTISNLPSLPSLPSIPDLLTVPDPPLLHSVPDAIASFRLPSVPEGDPSSPEGDSLSPEGASEVISSSTRGIIEPNFTDISATNILSSPTEPNQRRSSRASNAPSRLISFHRVIINQLLTFFIVLPLLLLQNSIHIKGEIDLLEHHTNLSTNNT